MLGKLIKHEFRATGRTMLPLLAAVLLLSPVAGLLIRLIDKESFQGFSRFAGVLAVIAFFVLLAALCVTSLVIMVSRFRNSLLLDEGYLSFTLPVRTEALIFSKLIVSFVWFTVTVLAGFCAVYIIARINYAGSDFSQARLFVSELEKLIGWGNIVLYALEALLCVFMFSCSVCLHFYAAWSLGYSTANHKSFLSVCYYILLSFVMTAVFAAFMKLIGNDALKISSRYMNTWMESVKAQQNYAVIPHMFFLGAALYFLFMSVLYYIPTILPLKKRLNLN